eukprot:PhM_4_TR18469/c1_g1_i1/m.77274
MRRSFVLLAKRGGKSNKYSGRNFEMPNLPKMPEMESNQSYVRRLPVEGLPEIPATLPRKDVFSPESSGMFKKEWLQDIPAMRATFEEEMKLPEAERFWKMHISEAMSEMMKFMPYRLRIHTMKEGLHSYEMLLQCADAPTPDILYEDIMQLHTYAQQQKSPDLHFKLEPKVVRMLLVKAAYALLEDADYFEKANLLFRKMEQQQELGSAGYSAWVMCCAAAGRVEEALSFLTLMDTHGLKFDVEVFISMFNPQHEYFYVIPRGEDNSGFVLQGRLNNRLSSQYNPSTVGLHAMFVMYNLTLSHVMKWELVRRAVQHRFVFSPRTVIYVSEVLKMEGCRRCGPLTLQALIMCFANNGAFGALLATLVRVRQNEMIEAHSSVQPELVVLPVVRDHVLQACHAAHVDAGLVERIDGLMARDEAALSVLPKKPLKRLKMFAPTIEELQATRLSGEDPRESLALLAESGEEADAVESKYRSRYFMPTPEEVDRHIGGKDAPKKPKKKSLLKKEAPQPDNAVAVLSAGNSSGSLVEHADPDTAVAAPSGDLVKTSPKNKKGRKSSKKGKTIKNGGKWWRRMQKQDLWLNPHYTQAVRPKTRPEAFKAGLTDNDSGLELTHDFQRIYSKKNGYERALRRKRMTMSWMF